MDILFAVLGVVVGLTVGGLLSWAMYSPYKRRCAEVESSLKSLDGELQENRMSLVRVESYVENERAQSLSKSNKIDKLLADIELLVRSEKDIYAKNSQLIAENNFLQDKLHTQKGEVLEMQKQSQHYFEKLANQILEEKSVKFSQVNKDSIETILKPLSDSIIGFKERVESTFTEETKQRSSLEAQVRELMEQTNKVSKEANNLASALKGDSKMRGNWGEMILESILQQSGLVKDREYFLQQHIKDSQTGKTIIPDVLVKLPDDRTIIIDSKVSLVAFDKLNSAQTPQEQQLYIKEHLRSIYDHIDSLSSKRYDSNVAASLNFTMMFVPIEPAYILAIQEDKELWARAYAKRIILISPTNLIACLKLMSDLWRRALQNITAAKIVEHGEKLYEKFVGFATSMEEVGRHLSLSQTSYTKAVKQLNEGNGNLVRQVLKLRQLGIQSSKEMPSKILGDNQQIEDEPEPSERMLD